LKRFLKRNISLNILIYNLKTFDPIFVIHISSMSIYNNYVSICGISKSGEALTVYIIFSKY
jgi:hypothetical protein